MTFARITIDPAVCGGKPCIRGLRFPVSRLLGLLTAGEARAQILKSYPYLETADIDEALRYAEFLADTATPVPLTSEEQEAILKSKAFAEGGEFATDEEVKAVWAKYSKKRFT